MRRTFPLVVIILHLASGCATQRFDLIAPVVEEKQRSYAIIVKRGTGYDRHGLPTFGSSILKRPQEPGEQFTVVYEVNNRPVKSYEIVVLGERKPDMTRPFEVLFQWTGRGFLVGAAMAFGTGPKAFNYDARTDLVYTTASVAPIAVMSAGGFIVGVVAGMVSAGEELRYAVISPQERVLSSTVYDHDQQGRLKRMQMFLPDERTEVVRTEYSYEGNGLVPKRTESRSYPEDRVRTISR